MKIVRFRHTKYIDSQTKNAWDRGVFNVSFREYNMQVQLYQQKGNSTFKELLKENPKAEQLNYKMHMAVQPYIEMMNGQLLDVVEITGKRCMTFESFDIKIINSQRNNPEKHLIEINFLSTPYIWMETLGNQLIIQPLNTKNHNVYVVKLNTNLTIQSMKEKA